MLQWAARWLLVFYLLVFYQITYTVDNLLYTIPAFNSDQNHAFAPARHHQFLPSILSGLDCFA